MSPLARLTGLNTRIGLVAENDSDQETSLDQAAPANEPFDRLADQTADAMPAPAEPKAKLAPLTLHSPILPERVHRIAQPVEDLPQFEEDISEDVSDMQALHDQGGMASDEFEMDDLEPDTFTSGMTDFSKFDEAHQAPADPFDQALEAHSAPEPMPMPTLSPAPAPFSEPEAIAPVPEPVSEAPAAAAPARRTSRVKTTFLGFDRSDGRAEDMFDDPTTDNATSNSMYPVGWLVIVEGEGHGTSLTLHDGVSQIGRGDDQGIQLDFGDSSISRSNHAAIAFDQETRAFYLGYGGKSNIVRLNGKPVLATETLEDGDLIRIGETTLRFIAFCGPEFSWKDQ